VILVVVDASVARACNDPASTDEAAKSFLFLQQLARRDFHLGVVVNEELDREWQKHGSGSFNSWLARMYTRRRVVFVKEKKSNDYRSAVQAVVNHGIKAALEKDLHLIELALFGQHPVASLDEKQRTYVTALIEQYSLLKSIQWINPVKQEGWVEWFERGCDRESFSLA
jgi:hypothetical protein